MIGFNLQRRHQLHAHKPYTYGRSMHMSLFAQINRLPHQNEDLQHHSSKSQHSILICHQKNEKSQLRK